MGYKTYRENAFQRVNQFDRIFKPWKKWENVRLSDICPCDTCTINKEVYARRYEIQMSGGLEEEITKPCKHCIDIINWEMECIEKLKWYENNDERLKND